MSNKVYTYCRRVEFHETDMAGIVHFSNYFRYMEAAECALFRELGLSIVNPDRDAGVSWPRGEVSCRFEAPLRFEDSVEIDIRPREIRPKRITYDLTLHRREGEERVLVATGWSTAICARFDAESGRLRATEIPQSIRRCLCDYFSIDETALPNSDARRE